MSLLPERADVVVIGAGLAGACLAAALRRRGRSCLVLEQADRPGLEASGRSAGMVREEEADEAVHALTLRGAAWHREQRAAGYRQTGSFLIGPGDEDVAALVPAARGRGRRFPGDGVVDGERLLVTLLDGVEVRCGVSVEGFRPRQGHAEVTTRAGVVRGRVLVNAAGAWAGVLGGLPLVPRKRHVFRAPTPPTLAGAPILWDVEHGLYLRPEGATVLACACDDMPGEPGDNAVRPGARGALEEKLARLQPAVGRLDLDGGWAGQRTFAPDDRPVVGWDSRMRGLFWLGGLGGWGVTVAPVLGELAADWLLAGPDGPTPTLLAPFHPSRLA